MSNSQILIGLPKERDPYPGITEHRVALTPGGVRDAISTGAQVVVETQAGSGAGFTDMEYEKAGARVVYSHEEVLGRCNLLVKIGPLTMEDLGFLAPETIVWGFMHPAVASDELLKEVQRKKLSMLGFEVMERANGDRPILRISSEIAGKMAPQIASHLLESPLGMGLLLGGLPGIPPADVVILGGGILGTSAAMSFLGTGACVYVLDWDRTRLERIHTMSAGQVVTAISTRDNLDKFTVFAEVLILATLVPGEQAPLLVKRSILSKMRPGSVVIDFSIDQGGASEVTREKGPQPLPYVEEGIVHFAVPNVPSRVPRTSSHAMNHEIFPFLKDTIEKGWKTALEERTGLQTGLYFYEGTCVSHHLRGRCDVHSLKETLKG